MWFSIRPAEIDFTRRSRHRIVTELVVLAPPERVFDLIVDDDAFAEWLKDFVAVRWTSDPPHGVGSTRDVELKTLAVREQFLVWDRATRLTFTMTALSIPIASQLVEDIRLHAESGGSTRIVWTVHYSPRLWVRPIHPLVRFVFGRLFRESLGRLKRMAESAHSPVRESRATNRESAHQSNR